MKKLIVIALCVLVQASFGYHRGPRATRDTLAIKTWRVKMEQLDNQIWALAHELSRIDGQIASLRAANKKPNSSLFRQRGVVKSKMLSAYNRKLSHLRRGSAMKIPGTYAEHGLTSPVVRLQWEINRVRKM
jgi:hypothetical protein